MVDTENQYTIKMTFYKTKIFHKNLQMATLQLTSLKMPFAEHSEAMALCRTPIALY